MHSTKETAANAAASVKAGMEKTKATVQEKVEKMLATGDPMVNEMAAEKKEERIEEAERRKQEAREHNVAGGGVLGHDYTTGSDYSTIGSTERGGYGEDREVRQDYLQGLSGWGHYPDQGATGDG